MAIDIARTSYDPARRYTGVAPQQGRVTLEADENEQRDILEHERRKELVDLVGPCATPDDGYAISSAGDPFDFTIGPGTMYVGGNRVELDEPITFSKQPDWVDQHDGLDQERPGQQHVVLLLTETDVTAVEDPVLREVALGGPDTAARTLLLQRVTGLATDGDDCAAALAEDEKAWAELGLTYDEKTAELQSNSRLLVTWNPPEAPPDPCQPSAKGGYLGAENQAIRVQVAGVDEDGTVRLLWGWDNASFLYRVTADDSVNPILTLERSPVDDFHRPRAGQAVQVVRAAADLETTDDTVEGYVAALTGQEAVLTAPYDPDTKTVQFPAPLPSWYTDTSLTPQLYLRVWENLITGVTLGKEVPLTGTGIDVTLSVEGGGPPHTGDFWIIGVRPETPDTVLPARFLRTPQPPNGPLMWACPLAVVAWNDGELQLLDDCRNPFPHGGERCCCTVTVEPSDATARGLQEIIDKAVAGRNPHDRSTRITVCIRPGRYELERPLVLERQHGHLHLEGCGEGVELAVAPGREAGFKQGMIVMAHADNVRISGIEFHLPQVPAATASIRPQERELQSFQQPVADVYTGLFVSIGIRPVHCAMLEIDHCLFRFALGPASTGRIAKPTQLAAGADAGATTIKVLSVSGMSIGVRICIDTGANLEAKTIAEIGTAGTQGSGVTLADPLEMAHQRGTPVGDCNALQETPRYVFGAAIFAGSECWGMRLERNRFLHDEPRQPPAERTRIDHVLVGLLLSPSLVYRSTETGVASRLPSGSLVRTLLVGGRIRDNEFNGLTLGVLAMAEIGDVRFEDNLARDCFGGIWLYSQRALAYAELAGKYTVAGNLEQATLQGLRAVLLDAAANPTLVQTSVIARTYPLPDQFLATAEDSLVAQRAQTRKKKTEAATWTQQFVDKAVAGFLQVPAPAEAGAAPAAEAKPATLSLAAPAPKGKTEVTSAQLHAVLSDFERAVALAPAGHGFDVRVTDNDLDCAVGKTGTTGAALLVWNTDDSAESTALVCDNRMSSLSPAPVASLQGIGQAIANGNLVTNRERDGLSLSIVAPDDAAVTGNILHGTPMLPARPLPAPLDDWLSLNTVS